MNIQIAPQNNTLPPYTDQTAHKFPVSVKGIIYHNKQYLLRQNERNEWELLGGKLEPEEEPSTCVIREIQEEADIIAITDILIDAWIYKLNDTLRVLILTYACHVGEIILPIISPENAVLSWFTYDEIQKINIPEGYKNSIKKFQTLLLGNNTQDFIK